MRRFAVLFLVCLIGIFFLASCENKKANTKDCVFQKEENSNLGSYLYTSGKDKGMTEVINNNTVKIYNQNIDAETYRIQLDEYFYEKNLPMVIYKFVINNKDGSALTESQYKDFKHMLDKHDLEFYNPDLGGHEVMNETLYDSDGKVLWVVSDLLDAISDKDSVSKIVDKTELYSIIFSYKSKGIGTIILPDYAYDAYTIPCNIPSDESVISIKVSKLGVSIIWDLTDILAVFKKMLKNLPAGENEEGYHYTIYNSILLKMKDGTIYELYGPDSKDILNCNKGIREEDNLASYSVLWKDEFNIEDISYISIDGKDYSLAH